MILLKLLQEGIQLQRTHLGNVVGAMHRKEVRHGWITELEEVLTKLATYLLPSDHLQAVQLVGDSLKLSQRSTRVARLSDQRAELGNQRLPLFTCRSQTTAHDPGPPEQWSLQALVLTVLRSLELWREAVVEDIDQKRLNRRLETDRSCALLGLGLQALAILVRGIVRYHHFNRHFHALIDGVNMIQ